MMMSALAAALRITRAAAKADSRGELLWHA